MSSCTPIIKWSTARGEFYWCSTCDTAYRDREGIVEHTMTHTKGVESHTCFECLKNFSDRKDFQAHMPRCSITVPSPMLDLSGSGAQGFH
ncbi:oocyte zinc finger protein XlCOF28-like [Penaeus chinensis]|uniref:oocyte zinc finger protein XlCOF28-like n=1 Tax=Penaeus chinensis TaxID=139456 RepID=UPI001FB8236E|nr:oocyte zinc finger protein XlCOF28-like [Penaeus chinensis]